MTIEYTVAVEDATAITLRVSSDYSWTGVGEGVSGYVDSFIKCRLYADGDDPPEWGEAEYELPSAAVGATGKLILDVKLDLSEELTPPELTGATLTVRVGVEKTTSGESA